MFSCWRCSNLIRVFFYVKKRGAHHILSVRAKPQPERALSGGILRCSLNISFRNNLGDLLHPKHWGSSQNQAALFNAVTAQKQESIIRLINNKTPLVVLGIKYPLQIQNPLIRYPSDISVWLQSRSKSSMWWPKQLLNSLARNFCFLN